MRERERERERERMPKEIHEKVVEGKKQNCEKGEEKRRKRI